MLKENDFAPDFELFDQNNKLHKLSDYKDKTIVLYFYPKDMTPGCTTEACNFRDD
ncbi:MAG: redoxin domain-containing protein, partial [Candidatus Woesearchaeota archaeon]